MPTIPEFRIPRFSVPDVPKMIPKIPWVRGVASIYSNGTSAEEKDVHGVYYKVLGGAPRCSLHVIILS